ncbi:MAG: DEAD/DEAH box helicase, partial [Candidatus Anammoxibacter sp.]
NNNQVIHEINDQTRFLPDVDFHFKGRLHDYQQEAVRKITSRRYGVLQAPTASGKTIIALNIISVRKQPTLIICHSKELMYQWQERIEQFLGIPGDQIGLIGDSHKTVGDKVTIAIVNSLKKCASEITDKIGFLVIDECHRTPSSTFTEAIHAFDCAYVLGLSATPYRGDGLSKLIYFFIGDKVHEISTQDLQSQNQIMTATLRIRNTDFEFFYDDNYPEMITALTEDYCRNELIVNDVLGQIRQDNGIVLLISDRVEHCRALCEMLRARDVEARILTGDTRNGERQKIVKELNQGNVKVLVASGSLIGEGFDCQGLSSIFLCTPIKYSGRLIQAIGRIVRVAEGKDSAVIYDYHDKNIGVLRNSFKSRLSTYQDLGIKTLQGSKINNKQLAGV